MKIRDVSFCRNWLFHEHDIDLNRWLDTFYDLIDHKNLLQWAWDHSFEMFTIIEDFIAFNEIKIERVLNEFTLGKSKIVLILGQRGSGKTATAFWLAENMTEERNIYWCGLPSQALPEWCKFIKNPQDIPDGSLAIVDEVALFHSARQFKGDKAIFLTQLLTILRHRNITVLFITQNSALGDINLERLADCVFYKPMSLFQYETERDSVRDLVIDKMLPKSPEQTLYVGSVDSFVSHLLFIQPLPICWSNELSKPFSTIKSDEDALAFAKDCYNAGFDQIEIISFLKIRGYTKVIPKVK